MSANDLTLIAYGLPAGQNGIFVYGTAKAGSPFGDGLLCLDSSRGIFRLEVQNAGVGGVLRQVVPLDQPPTGPGQILPGSRWSFQALYRDGGSTGAGLNLSQATEIQFLP